MSTKNSHSRRNRRRSVAVDTMQKTLDSYYEIYNKHKQSSKQKLTENFKEEDREAEVRAVKHWVDKIAKMELALQNTEAKYVATRRV